MSLKAFHIVFIAASVLLCFLVGGWSVAEFRNGQGVAYLTWGVVALGAGAVLLVYGRYFLRKFRRMSYL